MRDAAVTATVPSNIAFVKYWGKRDAARQWPANDSLSMTLSVARTITTARQHDGPADELRRSGPSSAGADKGLRHLAWLRRELGFAPPLYLETDNSFPADCGIASSASGLAALTLAAIAAWTGTASLLELERAGFPLSRLAGLARQGSGSACRSLFGGFVEWSAGDAPASQTVAAVASELHWPLADVIVLVSTAPKAVSSSAGHGAAWTSPLFEPRLAALPGRLDRIKAAIDARDIEALGELLETEALEMHAVMMSSLPSAVYMTRDTSRFLGWLRRERQASGLPAWFTLDAGPNPHVICERQHAGWVANRITSEFPQWELIMDVTGSGPALTRRETT